MAVSIGAESSIRKLIKDNGYISFSTFMENVVSAYYKDANSIGTDGDFITSPEISQLFGEMIGVWCAKKWEILGSPKELLIIELGPGRGTLMNDLLRATKNIPNFHDSITVYLIETSHKLREHQYNKLSIWSDNVKFIWQDDLGQIPSVPTLIIANEFFDALPVDQYVKIKNEWYENIITTLPGDGEFCISVVPASKTMQEYLSNDFIEASHRAIVEYSSHSIGYIKNISHLLQASKGAALIIDYGYIYEPLTRRSFHSTIQSIRNHKYNPIFKNIGYADITAHVNFYDLMQAVIVAGCQCDQVVTQREFLQNMGIMIRAELLLKNIPNQDKENFISRLHRLIDPKQMGHLFKVLQFSFLGNGN